MLTHWTLWRDPNKGYGPPIWETAYIYKINRAKKVKSDTQPGTIELGPRAKTVSLGVAGKDGVPKANFSNFRNCPKRVELGSSYSGCRLICNSECLSLIAVTLGNDSDGSDAMKMLKTI